MGSFYFYKSWIIALILSTSFVNYSLAKEPAEMPPLRPLTRNDIYEKSKYGTAIIYTTIKVEQAANNFPFNVNLPEKIEILSNRELINGEKLVLKTFTKITDSSNQFRQSGSGWFADKDGTLITDMHVVREDGNELETMIGKLLIKEYSYEIQLLDRRTENNTSGTRIKSYKAEFLGSDFNRDTAALKVLDIDPKDYDICEKGDSNSVKTTDEVFTLGAPHGLSDSFGAPGVVSKTHRLVGMWFIEDFLQLTLPTRPGNSGSPVFNDRGKVIGMIDLGIRGGDSLSFAIPSNLIDIPRLKSQKGAVIKKVSWGADVLLENFIFMGSPENLDIQDLDKINAETGLTKDKMLHTLAKISDDHWAILTQVETGSIAEKAGLQKGDIVTKVKHKDTPKNILTGMGLRIAIADIPGGEEFEIEYERIDPEGRINKLTAKIKLP